MLSTAGSTTPPPAPRDQAPLPYWPALRGLPLPPELLEDRAWIAPPAPGRWRAALRRLLSRVRHVPASAPPAPAPAVPAATPTAARPAAARPAAAGADARRAPDARPHREAA